MKLLFIRHGQTSVNVNNLTHRTGDEAGLTDEGKKQAEEIVSVCRENKIESIFSSPEKRALETANIVATRLSVGIGIIDGLRERNFGSWEGKPWSEISSNFEGMDIDQRYTFVPPGGESWQSMERRLQEAIDHIVAQSYESVAIVTHEGALRALVPLLRNDPKETSLTYNFSNTEVIRFEFKDSQFYQI